MLHGEAVEPATLELVKKLMVFEPLAAFNLVKGTALALQFGHRKPIAIDLFGHDEFDQFKMLSVLSENFKCSARQTFANTILCTINDIKTDILRYKYPLLDKVIVEDGIRMLSPKDIAPMKLAALSQRGVKKDYYDIYTLLQYFTLGEMLELYKQKFGITEVSHVVRSLNYFDDAEKSDEPEILIPVKWKEVKKVISGQVDAYITKK